MRGEVAALHKRLGNTMVYVTHDQVEAMTMADKIAVLRDGRVEQYGAPLELYNRPTNRFVAGFIGSPKMNFLPAQLKDGTLSLGNKVVQSGLSAKTIDPRVTLGIRPNHLTVDDNGPVLFNVKSVEQLGGESYLFGQVQIDAATEDFTLHMAGQTSVRSGDQIRLSFDAEHMHVFDAEDQRLCNANTYLTKVTQRRRRMAIEHDRAMMENLYWWGCQRCSVVPTRARKVRILPLWACRIPLVTAPQKKTSTWAHGPCVTFLPLDVACIKNSTLTPEQCEDRRCWRRAVPAC